MGGNISFIVKDTHIAYAAVCIRTPCHNSYKQYYSNCVYINAHNA